MESKIINAKIIQYQKLKHLHTRYKQLSGYLRYSVKACRWRLVTRDKTGISPKVLRGCRQPIGK